MYQSKEIKNARYIMTFFVPMKPADITTHASIEDTALYLPCIHATKDMVRHISVQFSTYISGEKIHSYDTITM